MDAEIAPTLQTDNLNLSNGGSPVANLDSGSGQAVSREYIDNAACEKRKQSPLPVKSLDKGVHDDSEPGFSVPDHLEDRAINDLDEFNTNIENIVKVQKETISCEKLESKEEQEKDQEFNSDSLDRQNNEENNAMRVSLKLETLKKNDLVRDQLLPCHSEAEANMDGDEKVRKVVADTVLVESQDKQEVNQELNPDSAKPQKEDRNAKHAPPKSESLMKDPSVSDQLPPENECVDEDHKPNLECGAINDLIVLETNMENFEVQKEDADAHVVESQDRQQDQELNSDCATLQNREDQNATRASEESGNLMNDNSVDQLPPDDEGVDKNYEPCFSASEHLEHRPTIDPSEVDVNMESVEEVTKEVAVTEVVESLEKQEQDLEVVEKEAADSEVVESQDKQDHYQEEMQLNVADTEVVESQNSRALGPELNSDCATLQNKEDNNAKCASLESESLMNGHSLGQLPPESEGVDTHCFSGSDHLEHIATDDQNEVDVNMESVEEVPKEAADIVVVESLDKQEQDQEEVHIEAADTDVVESQDRLEQCQEEVQQEAADTEVVESQDRQEQYQEEVQKEAADTEVVESQDRQEQHQEEVQKETVDTEVVDSQDKQEQDQELNSDSAKSQNHENPNSESLVKDHSVNDQVLPENEGVDEDYEPLFSMQERLEHESTDNHSEDVHMKIVEEVQNEAASTGVVESQDNQEQDQELNSDRAEAHNVEDQNAKHAHSKSENSMKNDGVSCQMELENDDIEEDFASEISVPEHLECRSTNDLNDSDTHMEDIEEVQEEIVDSEAVMSLDEQESDEELSSDSAKRHSKTEKNVKHGSLKSGSLVNDHHVTYQLPPEKEGEFAIFDLVWGKVKSHPWWPGQIFHPSDSSEKALKYYKKDCYLVAYFGDRTFAWNDASVLKPFRNHFPQAEKQKYSEAFQNAVNCALEEVSRRVELGLSCSCASEEAYGKIKYQVVENSGIREESNKREGVDRSMGVDSFQPDKLTEYVRALALFPTSGADRLELVIAKAQLLAFNHLRGYDTLPGFQYYEGLVEFEADSLPEDEVMRDEDEYEHSVNGVNAKKGPRKRKHNLKDIVYRRRKEKTVTELMGETMYYLDGEFDSFDEDDISLTCTASAKKRPSKFHTDDFTAPQNTKTISVAKVSNSAFTTPQQSFKVGELISKVASQMTGSSTNIKDCSKGNNKNSGTDANEEIELPSGSLTKDTTIQSKKSSLDDMLSQLHLSARDPMKGYSFLSDIVSFFSEFRNSAVITQRKRLRQGAGRKKKSDAVVGPSETLQVDDGNDSYWTDMVVQHDAETKPSRRGRKRKGEQVARGDNEKPLQLKPKKNSRKKYHHGDHEAVPEMPTEDDKKLDLPAELLLNFGETGSVPSIMSLNKMFRCFGTLKEAETEVDTQGSRARVVFKKRSDAEVAYSSAATFNIFGSILVNYQLNYTPVSFRNNPRSMACGKEE
ncbi:uncharacterized protein LOC130803503 [Amaranthus tricolor]|uniref:uncharacterized protein LOC130803503 n=1 Tax=Amaranthus tricolor TaxID=29722 RepID=UPI00258259B7|nr:uncharacterized protein LOC130803503 [Amaranthus tricolor]XP_057523603.1 uncharacterized protein LOC130803503 [Amaranthus tricolor]